MTEVVRGLVLAAGLGTRLWPLTHHVPKPLLPYLGRTLLDRAIDALFAADCDRVVVNAHHLAEQIVAHVEAHPRRARLRVSHEPRILGTGGALDGARAQLEGADVILLYNGDVASDVDPGALLAARRRDGSLATLAVCDWPEVNTVTVARDGRVLDLAGRLQTGTDDGARRRTYTGIAALAGDVLGMIPPGPSDLVTALVAAMQTHPGTVRACEHAGRWMDLGTVTRYLDAHAEALGPDFVSAPSDVAVPTTARLRACVVLPGAAIAPDGEWARAVLGPGWQVTEAQNLALAPAAVRGLGFPPETRVTPLVGAGSTRRFWRLATNERTAVVMRDEPGSDEVRRSVAIATFLHAQELGGAGVLAADVDQGVMVTEDLGDMTLERLARHDPSLLPAFYAQALELLAELQTRGTAQRDACRESCDRTFDHDYLRWETDYFAARFLVGHAGCDAAQIDALVGEFDALARAVLLQPQVLVHRDFQAQNVLVHASRIRVVDVQGMRLGPVAYDVMALLRDSYVELDDGLRGRLRDEHRERLRTRGFASPDLATWRAWCTSAGLQRVMQSLGAFGFLAHVRGKPAYLACMPPGLRHLRALLAEAAATDPALAGAPPPLPRLTATLARIVT